MQRKAHMEIAILGVAAISTHAKFSTIRKNND
jgi:hypothetical protein